jgi:hypothetical protein
MGTIRVLSAFLKTDICDKIVKGVFEIRSIFNCICAICPGAIRVMDHTMGRPSPIDAFDKEAVGRHLQDMGIVWPVRDSSGFYFNGNDGPSLLNQVIGSSGETDQGVVQWLLGWLPCGSIAVDYTSTW